MSRQDFTRNERWRHLPEGIRQRNAFALQHLGLAGLVASRQQRRGPEDRDDLMQEALLGLVCGAGRFDRQRGVKPSTYLVSCARGQVLHYRRDRAGMIRIPWRLRDLYAKGLKHQQLREQERLPALSSEELAGVLRVKPTRWQEACRCQQLLRIEPMLEPESTPNAAEEDDPQLTWLRQALRQLSRRDQQLLELHLLKGQSLKLLARNWAMPYQQLRRRLETLIEQLRDWAKRDGLQGLPST